MARLSARFETGVQRHASVDIDRSWRARDLRAPSPGERARSLEAVPIAIAIGLVAIAIGFVVYLLFQKTGSHQRQYCHRSLTCDGLPGPLVAKAQGQITGIGIVEQRRGPLVQHVRIDATLEVQEGSAVMDYSGVARPGDGTVSLVVQPPPHGT